MTKAELIEDVSRVVEMSRKDSEIIVETIFDSIVKSLKAGDKIEIRGFGSFRTRQRKPRIGRNPKTGARVDVPAKKIPYFKPSKELKDLVNTSPSTETPAAPPAPASGPESGDSLGVRSPPTGLSETMDYLWSPWRYRYVSQAGKGEGCPFCQKVAWTLRTTAKTWCCYRGREQLHPAQSLSLHYRPRAGDPLRPCGHPRPGDARNPGGDDGAYQRLQTALKACYNPEGYNLGMNLGRCAGAGVADHLHLHLLPRWTGIQTS